VRTLALLAASCGALGVAAGGATAPSGLLLWNKLGNAYQVTHSAVGPNLTLYNCHDRTTPSFGDRCSTDVTGKLTFVRGVSGQAAMIHYGPYFPAARVHTALLRQSILNPEHGAVEAWFRQRRDPAPFVDNPHLIFGGPYDLSADDVNLFVQDRVDSGDPRLHFSVYFGNGLVWARSLSDHGIGYPISKLNGTWVHIAGVWDRRGIGGSRDTVRLYVNGVVVAASQKAGWGKTPCGRRRWGRHLGDCFIGVVGCNDTCAGTFAVDELKVWSYAKTY
jgi:hypothetical protein